MTKTNAMRILDGKKIKYNTYTYDPGNEIDGISVAAKINKDVSVVYKTLVTQGNDKNYYVFVLPVICELDLKKAAKAAGVKSVEMIHVKDINKVTGYIRGGCSPVGMRKQYKTFFDISARDIETITVSAGKIGIQIELFPDDLVNAVCGCYMDICK